MTTPSPTPGTPQTVDKAAVAAVVTFLLGAVTDYMVDADEFSLRGLGLALLAAAAQFGATYAKGNRPATGSRRRGDVGQITPERLIVLIILGLIAVALFVFLFDFNGGK